MAHLVPTKDLLLLKPEAAMLSQPSAETCLPPPPPLLPFLLAQKPSGKDIAASDRQWLRGVHNEIHNVQNHSEVFKWLLKVIKGKSHVMLLDQTTGGTSENCEPGSHSDYGVEHTQAHIRYSLK